MRRIALLAAAGSIVALVLLWTGRRESGTEQVENSNAEVSASEESDLIQGNEPAPLPSESSSESLSSRTEDQSSSQDGTTTPRVQIWSETPEELENRLRNELRSGRYGSISIDEIACFDTECTILFSKSDSNQLPRSFFGFTDFVRSPPINACGVGTRTDENPDGTYQQRITINTCRTQLPDDYTAGLPLTEDELRRFGERFLSPEDFDAAPVIVSDAEGVRLVVENICSTDCPLDLQQVVHWESSEGLPCEEIDRGVPTPFLARTNTGAFVERVLCVSVPYE